MFLFILQVFVINTYNFNKEDEFLSVYDPICFAISVSMLYNLLFINNILDQLAGTFWEAVASSQSPMHLKMLLGSISRGNDET